MKILVTSTNEEDPIKIEGATVDKTLNIIFSNTQGQLIVRLSLMRKTIIIS